MRAIGRFSRFVVAAAVGCALIGVVAFAGCGGGSDSSTTAGASGASGANGGTPLSQDEFVSQANAVCKDNNDQQAALKQPTSSDLSSIATYLGQSLAITNDAYTKLAAITPPSDQQSDYSRWLSDKKDQLAIARQIEDAAKAGNRSKVNSRLQQLNSSQPKGDAEAMALGLTECGKNASSNS